MVSLRRSLIARWIGSNAIVRSILFTLITLASICVLLSNYSKRGLSRKGGGDIGISYYIGPQVWAWKAKRRFKIGAHSRSSRVIFPFEVECFADTELPTDFVGHPFVRESYQLPFCYDASAPMLLLPGSRTAAVGRIFPLLLQGFEIAQKSKPELNAKVVYPSHVLAMFWRRCYRNILHCRARLS